MDVLVVDDDTFVKMILGMELADVAVLEASGIADAQQLVRDHTPDAVVVDRHLLDGDGLDLVRDIRRYPPTRQVPVVVLTAGHDEAHRREALQAGADDYVAKPFDAHDLAARVEWLCDVPADERRLRRQDQIRAIDRDEWIDDVQIPERDDVIDLREEEPAPTGVRGLLRRLHHA